ncbi:MAG TPA: FAD-binding oxidoreductase [Dehalococcoidia bacterium]|jgi:glycine oxidase|nr:FAD-binding oxidoreductase [Dehalococcoidia bacterium]MEE2927948.1 FAD-dependent oxidoreductase [Chloroflexota bacterium]HIM47979.1 FAD-binding oxidoreductase [Dehalococcoidia bacterium]|tara:strand:+ start:488 stop:1612 length:1125 start_codon:yes stop_codon:yes gene_type:complete
MPESSDVVIVGGGAAGCSVAYHLALAGVKSTIIEGQGVATQASGFSAGGLNPLQGTGIPGPLGSLAMESYLMHLDLFGQLQDDTGIDYDGRIISLLKVAFDEEELAELQETEDVFAPVDGFETRWLDNREVLELEPRVSPKIIRGLVARGNAAMDSYKYTLALLQSAEKMGASIRSGTVAGLERDNNRITGVRLDDETISCGQIVLAMGPWSRKAEAWLDAYIPVDPLKGEITRMELPGTPLNHDLSGGGGSLHPKPDGLVWCGTTEEWRGFDKETSTSAHQSILEGAVRLVPDMADARLSLQTACLRPVTPDWLPIIGRLPGWDNVYLATGAGKKGILLSPGIGKSVADLMTQGETSLSIGPFSPDRFTPNGF